jgi:hypothetical protein
VEPAVIDKLVTQATSVRESQMEHVLSACQVDKVFEPVDHLDAWRTVYEGDL